MTSRALSHFPAVLVGGPPHAGKSVLARSLKEALAEAGVAHYLLRAAPDGEGDWFHQADPALARALRRKSAFTPEWVAHMCRDIAYRPLPFLVDVGGRPEPWQEAIIDQCSHAILLVTGPASLEDWQERLARHHLLPIAILTSQLEGESRLEPDGGPVLRGVIAGLERGRRAEGPVFEAVLARVKALFDYSADELLATHEAQAPVELVIDAGRMYRQLCPGRPGYTWQPEDLPAVLDYLPQAEPLALYGRVPAWLCAAVAAYIHPQPFYQFDARRGWLAPVRFLVHLGTEPSLRLAVFPRRDALHLQVELADAYLAYESDLALPLPPVSSSVGVVLSGKLPNWLYTGLALFYRAAPWVAVYSPQRQQAVIVSSQQAGGSFQVGRALAFPGPPAP